jgi:hypothetical protein
LNGDKYSLIATAQTKQNARYHRFKRQQKLSSGSSKNICSAKKIRKRANGSSSSALHLGEEHAMA